MFQIIRHGTKFDFIGKQGMFLAFSALLMVGSIVALFAVGLNYGIDFQGGSDMILSFEKPVTNKQVEEAAIQAGFSDATVQRFGSESENPQFLVQTREVSVMNEVKIKEVEAEVLKLAKIEAQTWSAEQPDRYDLTLDKTINEETLEKSLVGLGLESVDVEKVDTGTGNNYVVRFQDLGARVRKGFATALPDAFNPDTGLERLETVGARVGNQLREDGLTAVLLALIAILIYIAVRFDIRYAPGAVAALFHDVLFSMGVLSIVQMEINLPILASILTIVGYSLNDTIVVFDRIRENYTSGRGGSNLSDVINASLNETLSRTINTSITTLLAVVIIWTFGSGLIANFAFTLMIGVIIGTYSSIFVASPILLMMDAWLRRQEEAKALRAKNRAPTAASES